MAMLSEKLSHTLEQRQSSDCEPSSCDGKHFVVVISGHVQRFFETSNVSVRESGTI